MRCIFTYVIVCILSNLKSVPRYKFLISDICHPDTFALSVCLCVCVCVYIYIYIYIYIVLWCFNLHTDTTPPQPYHNITPTHIEPDQYNPRNNSTHKSQAPDDGCINIRNMLSII